jgi:hypothetical protein
MVENLTGSKQAVCHCVHWKWKVKLRESSPAIKYLNAIDGRACRAAGDAVSIGFAHLIGRDILDMTSAGRAGHQRQNAEPAAARPNA